MFGDHTVLVVKKPSLFHLRRELSFWVMFEIKSRVKPSGLSLNTKHDNDHWLANDVKYKYINKMYMASKVAVLSTTRL